MKVVRTKQVAKVSAAGALFTGNVERQVIFEPEDSQNFNYGIVHFSAGSRNKMHTHSSDQLLIVVEGTGVVATEHEEATVSEGDVALIPAGEHHWHGAPGDTAMAHIAITARGSQTTQLEP